MRLAPAAVLTLFVLLSCSPPHVGSQLGRPLAPVAVEINAPPDRVAEEIIKRYGLRGIALTKTSEYTLQSEWSYDSSASAIWLANLYGEKQHENAYTQTFYFLSPISDGKTRVSGRMRLKTDTTGPIDISDRMSEEIRNFLNELKSDLESTQGSETEKEGEKAQ